MTINKVILVGIVGNDPQINENQNQVTTFSLATHFKDKNGEKQTEWHNIVFFGKKCDFINQYIKKGTTVYIEGRINYSEYLKDNVTMKYTKIVGYDIQIIKSPLDNQSNTRYQNSNSNSDDEIPF